MATNILSLPRLRGSFLIARNADWLDSIYFTAPGQPTDAVQKTGQLVIGTDRVVLLDGITGLYTGMHVAAVEIPTDARVTNITVNDPEDEEDETKDGFDMVQPDGRTPVYATASNAATLLTFLPVPFDLTGIEFVGEVRKAVEKHEVFLAMSTDAGTLINGGVSGYLSFNVPRSLLAVIDPGSYVLDIIAFADGVRVNLFPAEPASLLVNAGVTTEPVVGATVG
jgi:hypothetical protein